MELWKVLANKEAQIYKVSDKYYFIGCGVFEECDYEKQTWYCELWGEFNRLCKDYSDLSVLNLRDVTKLKNSLNKIEKCYKFVDTTQFKDEKCVQTRVLVESLSDLEMAELEDQINAYIRIFNLCDEAFYRESDVYKM